MRVVLVSAPGEPGSDHWSNAAAAELARVLAVGGAAVEWFRARGSSAPTPPGVRVHDAARSTVPLHRVQRANDDPALEAALTRALRSAPAEAVVHLGAGARGSSNVAWLADRMGSAVFMVVRAAEVVCHRGTLVDRDGAPCTNLHDAERCRRCCTTGWLQRPRAVEFVDRWDSLMAGLTIATAVFVATPFDAERLGEVGVPKRALVLAHEPAVIAARLRGPSTAPN